MKNSYKTKLLLIAILSLLLVACNTKNETTKENLETDNQSSEKTGIDEKNRKDNDNEVDTTKEEGKEKNNKEYPDNSRETIKETSSEVKLNSEDKEYFDNKTVDSEKVFLVNFEGKNGQARVNATPNTEYSQSVLCAILGVDNYEEATKKANALDPKSKEYKTIAYINSISASFDDNGGNLKKGDKMIIKIVTNDKYKAESEWKLSKGQIEVEVEGLE